MQLSNDEIGQGLLEEELHQNVIKVTRRIIRPMNETQRFEKAKSHIMDAMKYKHPRFQSQSLETSRLFKELYQFQSSLIWEWLLFICGYLFLYLNILDSQSYAEKIVFESAILVLFWVDMAILTYCKKFDNFVKKTKYSSFFYFKLTIIILMTIDLIIFIAFPCFDSRPIRPFRVLRSFVPILFDPEMRKSLLSLASAYKDVLVYLIFFSFVIFSYALVGTKSLTFDPSYSDPDYPSPFDPYKTNYLSLKQMIFSVYVTATFDAYPDNQILAIQNYQPNYIYYIVFIFFNMFIFSSIPGSIIYQRYRETRSKIILIDEIRQQHSLILAFVTLAQSQPNLPIEKLIKFLLYLYRYKIRYIGYITDICLKLDDHNNHYIQVNQFMQLSKILQENSAMTPPNFDDIHQWVKLRKLLNSHLHLKTMVSHWLFSLTISIFILLSSINALFFLYEPSNINQPLNYFFITIFLVELVVRILAIGPQNLFAQKWNIADSFIIILSFVLLFIQDKHIDSLVIIWRIFRVAELLKIAHEKLQLKRWKSTIYLRLKSIFEIILEIIPIIIRFMPLFLFFFYIYAIIGMEIFYGIYAVPGNAAYNQYEQYGNFKSFVFSQYVMVQILTEAGWSQIAFDHCWRAPQYFALIMLFFCFLHITIVYIIATLIKGAFWEIFITVTGIFAERKKATLQEQAREKQIAGKAGEIFEINQALQSNEFIEANTIIRRQLIENKFDQLIFRKLKKVYEKDKKKVRSQKNSRGLNAQKIIDDWDINIDNLSQRSRYRYKKHSSIVHNSISSERSRISIREAEEIEQEDIESEIDQLLDKLLINPQIKYHQIVAHPKIFVEFLKSKFRRPDELIKQYEFDLHLHPLHNQQSMYYHIYEINALLNIEISKREQKALIIRSLIEENVIDEDLGEKLIKKKLHEKIFNIDTRGTLRRMFLAETNETLINKFQTEYFSDLYGCTFKHINKMTLEPLLKLEATLTYSLRNIMRYPQINNTEFFEMMTSIEDQISNQLLQRGSLFKFVYKLKYEGDIWFSIEFKRQQQMRIHFIKSGLWCYCKDMMEKQVLYARDLFNWNVADSNDPQLRERYIKRFYQGFEGLAFSLLNEQQFFENTPKSHVYDLYIQHFDVDKIERLRQRKLEISKIMVVILSKEDERADLGMNNLPYNLSEIEVVPQQERRNVVDFELDEADDEVFKKLKNIAAMDVERIVESEGLPFSYIVNLMKEISDVISIYAANFIYQIEKVLNEEYEEKNEASNNTDNKPDDESKSSKPNIVHFENASSQKLS